MEVPVIFSGVTLVPTVTHSRTPYNVYLSTLTTKKSRSTIKNNLDRMAKLMSEGRISADEFPWERLGVAEITALKARFIEANYSPATVNLLLSTLKGVIAAAWSLEMISTDTYMRIKAIKGIRAQRIKKLRAMEDDEIKRFVSACLDDTNRFVGLRDLCSFALMVTCGLRRGEVASLTFDDYKPKTGTIEVLFGKGNKQRTVYLPVPTIAILEQYIQLRGKQRGALLVAINKKGEIASFNNVTGEAVYLWFKDRLNEIGIEGLTPHDLRATYITVLESKGVKLGMIAGMVGHANVDTTLGYLRYGEHQKRQASHAADDIINTDDLT